MRIEDHLQHFPDPRFRARLKQELMASLPAIASDAVVARRIGILADTHCNDQRRLPASVLRALDGSDLIIHCGDITSVGVLDELEAVAPVLAVRGDNDDGRDPRMEDTARVIEVGAFRIGVTFNLKLPQRPARNEIREIVQNTFAGQVDMVVSAATHLAVIQRRHGTWFLNPGSPTLPADGRKSLAIVQIDSELRPRLVELKEGEKS